MGFLKFLLCRSLLRKKAALEPTDLVDFYFESLDEDKSFSQQVLNSQEHYIRDAIGYPLLPAALNNYGLIY
ncbi:hypothetical protein Pint_05424 [Pistacia integerrima]|uniref:Uncharacterized protein n=1 Tax=Pistacia integerrima TaxID=434235 RepID=A0ACC0Z4Q1_9ROSI|nr:hypothetical protein Pint_05424 [Pistacia integerrima]